MKCVHTFGTGRHKRQADITLLFEYISSLTTFWILMGPYDILYTALYVTLTNLTENGNASF